MINKWIDTKVSTNLGIFILLSTFLSINVFLVNNFIASDTLISSFYSEQLTREQLDKLLESNHKWAWLNYFSMPILILLRSSLVAICLSIGTFFYNIENKIPFKKFFRVALVGEFVLVLVGYFKLGYFYFIKTDYTLPDLQQYYPLSYINFLDLEKIEPWLIYPLQTINLFEVAYFFVLVYGMHKLLMNSYGKDLEITAVSYGSGLIIWIGLVMFLTLNYT